MACSLVSLLWWTTLAASRALAPASPAQDGSLQLPPPSLAASLNLGALGNSAADPILQAALESSDPLSSLRNASQQPLGGQVYLCSGDQYGYNLPLMSCLTALKLVPDIREKFSFGPKTQGNFNFETPYRILSGKYTLHHPK